MHKIIKTIINSERVLFLMLFLTVCHNDSAQAEQKDAPAKPAEQNVSVSSADDEQNTRNPFQPYVPPEEKLAVEEIYAGESSESSSSDSEDEFDYSSLRVTGSVWGNDAPKAIINDQVMGIGSVVNEAKIINITREGILFEFKGKQYLMKREGVSDKGGPK